MTPSYLRFLGGARIEREDGALRGRAAQRRRLALLALLAAAPTGRLTRERIVGYLWPDHPPDAARRLLSESLYVIRRELGDEAVEAVGDELCLNPERVGSDVADFLAAVMAGQAASAVKLYTGPFLDAWYVDDAPEFEAWAEREREQLAGQYRDCLRILATRAEADSNWQDAARMWEMLGRTEPLSAGAAVRHASALMKGGERAAALRVLKAHEAIVRRDLELPPEPQVVALMGEIRRDYSRADERFPIPEEPEASEVPEALEPVTIAESKSAGEPPSDPRVRNRRRRVAAAVLIVGTVCLLAATAALATRRTLAVLRHDPPDPRRLAVLYFDDHSEGKALGYLADGLTEELITRLRGVRGLHVVSRNGVRPYRDRPVSVDSISRVLAIGSIVEGSVQESEGRLRVNVSLVDVASGAPVAGTTLERPKAELFSLLDDVSNRVAQFLRERLGDEVHLQEVQQGTQSLAARDLVLRAERARKDASIQASGPDTSDVKTAKATLLGADSLLAMAELADPNWVVPPVERGWVSYDMALMQTGTARLERLQSGIRHVDRAIARDVSNASAFEARGTLRWRLVLDSGDSASGARQFGAAEADLRRAIALDSSSAAACATLSRLLREAGMYAEADVYAQRALAADAYLENSGDVLSQLFRNAMTLGDDDRAKAWCAQAHATRPDDWRFIECELTLMRNNPARADPRRAWDIVAELDLIDPPSKSRAASRKYQPYFRQLVAAAVSARHGDRATAERVLRRAPEEARGDPAMAIDMLHDLAFVHLALGHGDIAARLLTEYLDSLPKFRGTVMRDPAFKRLGLDVGKLPLSGGTR